jgi:hypothetical protein
VVGEKWNSRNLVNLPVTKAQLWVRRNPKTFAL